MERKTRRLVLVGFALIVLATISVVRIGKNQDALAGGGSASGDGGGTAGTSPCTSGVCYSKVRGGGWIKYAPDNISDSITIGGEFGISGGTLNYCKSIGATEYYVLAPALFDSNGFVRQFGMMTVNEFKADGWTFRPNLAGGDDLNWDTMKKKFKEAKKAAQAAGNPIDQSFGETSAFCYNPEWEDVCTEDDPDCIYEEDDKEGSTVFWSKSTVKVSDPDITGGLEVTTKKNGSAKVYFSTDKSSVTVDFSHTIGYSHGSFKMNPEDTTVGDTVTTNWNVKDAYTVEKTGWGALSPDADHEDNPSAAAKSVTIDFGEGYGTKERCSTIEYDRKNVALTGKWICDNWVCGLFGCSCTRSHYEYSASYSNTGSSSVCVEVTRPEPPSGDPGPTAPGGGVTSQIMFAGETTSLVWNGISAKGVPTRRLRDAEAIKFLVDEIPGYDGSKLAKVPTTKSDPCTTYEERFGGNLKVCLEHESTTHNTEAEPEVEEFYSAEASVKVPDEVGYKYCHSYGYSFEYWYGVLIGKNEDKIEWTHDTPKDYWYVFNASCRGIAKKPSVAVWNGSLLTSGSIITSLARRHNAIAFGEAANEDKTLYGSWAEYLAAANNTWDSDRTMGSGSSLSRGSGISKLCDGDVLSTNSTMTVANSTLGATTCSLQPSGIQPNSSFVVRLNAYLRDAESKAQITRVNDVAELYGGVNGNMVLSASGDVNITQDIKISNEAGGYTLHSIPQAVIFTNGNIKISEDVQRIDAWLIAPYGSINTCTSFATGDTTSDGKNSSGNNCTQQLVFNGPVVTKNMELRRSYGADPTISRRGTFNTASEKQTPAEIFNLRADSYLWGYAQASRYGSSYSEVYSRELAPRY